MGCATKTEKSLLEERAGYDVKAPPNGMSEVYSKGVRYVPTRVPEKVVVAWLHPKELPSKDYFWGAWISVLVAPESWEMKKATGPDMKGKKAGLKLSDSTKPTSKRIPSKK